MAMIAAVIGRILIAVLFVFSGIGKIMDPAGTAQYMEAASPFPGSTAVGVGIFEIVAGLVLASGFMTRIASIVLIVFVALATLFFHNQVTDPMQAVAALKNLAIIGGLLMVFAYGQVRGRMGVIDEREKRYDADVRAARAEGIAEGATATTHTRVVPDRDGDGHPG